MPIQQLPLMKGVGKDFRNADYIDYLPVNMLATFADCYLMLLLLLHVTVFPNPELQFVYVSTRVG